MASAGTGPDSGPSVGRALARYTISRLLVFAVVYVVARLIIGDALLALAAAVLGSAVLSIPLLADQRRALNEASAARGERRRGGSPDVRTD
jgi:hypothetical protein